VVGLKGARVDEALLERLFDLFFLVVKLNRLLLIKFIEGLASLWSKKGGITEGASLLKLLV